MSSAIDPSKLKVVELRNELQERGLDTKGNKAALVQRLKEALEKETNTSIPDTSILETSTEDLDASQNEDAEDESSTKDKSSEDKMDVDSTENPAPKTSESSKTPEKSQADSANKVNQSPAKPQDSKSSEEKTESEAAQNGEQAVADKDDKGEDQTKDKTTEEGGAEQKGAKRKREGNSPDREGGQKVVRAKSPIKEDEPVIDAENVQLNWYDSDLHLQVNKENFLSAKPFTDGAFGYAWAGVRASHGVSKGKVCFEVKISEEITWEDLTKIAERRQDSRRNQKRDRDKKGRKNDDKKAGEKKADEKEDKDKAAKPEENTEVKKETTENGEKEDGATTESTETKAEPTEKKPEEMDTSTTEETKPAAEEAPMETNTSETAEGEKKPEEAVKKEGETKEGEDKEAEKDAEPEKKEPEEPPLPIHLVRIGWSLLSSSLQLGEDKCSYAYESTGKFVNDKQFIDYGKTFAVGDVVGAYLSIDDEYVTIRYTVNGELQPVAATLQRSEFPEEFALFPHVLTRNCAFEMNLGQKEEPWFAAPDLMKEYVFLTEADDKINGPTRPETRGDCEVILMCGLPGSGKTHWVKEHIGSNIDKRYTVIGNSSLLERMTVAGNPLRTKFKGKWSIFVDRLQKCLNALITLASQRRRNYIIDQTNVFPSAQRRKMRPFEGFKRKAVIVVVGDEEQTKRQALQESTDGKGVPDSVILEMKAAMSLPETGDWMDEVVYAGLDEAATKEQVKKYNEAGKSAGYGTEKRFRGDRFRGKRNDFRGKGGGDRRFPDRRFERRGGRGPRGGGGGRGGAGGGGGWRDRQDRRGPPPSRDYRGRGGGRDYGGRDFTRRDSGGFNRNRNLDRSGGGRWSGGGGGRSSGGWSSGGGGGGGWSQQSYGSGTGGYGNWGGQGGGGQWKYGGGGGQQGYGGGYGGRQGGGGGGAWDYYGQYGANQNWNSHK